MSSYEIPFGSRTRLKQKTTNKQYAYGEVYSLGSYLKALVFVYKDSELHLTVISTLN